MKIIRTKSLSELCDEAKKIATDVRGGEMIGLIGPLGAGKTTFVQFVAQALGVQEQISSPTFTLLQCYELRIPNSELRFLIHIDCYRLTDDQEKNWRELLSIGLQDWLERQDAVIIIEWADRLPKKIQKKIKLLALKRA